MQRNKETTHAMKTSETTMEPQKQGTTMQQGL